MTSNKKYLLAGSIIAGVGTIYAFQRNVDSSIISDYIEKNKEEFKEVIEEIISLSIELLEKIVRFLKRLILEATYKIKLYLNV